MTPNLPCHSHRKVDQECYGEKWNEHPRREKEQIGAELFGISCYVQISDQDNRSETDVEATEEAITAASVAKRVAVENITSDLGL